MLEPDTMHIFDEDVHLLDEEAIMEPATLLAVIDELLTNQRMLEEALSLLVLLVLELMGRTRAPSDAHRDRVVQLVRRFVSIVKAKAPGYARAEQLLDFLEAKE